MRAAHVARGDSSCVVGGVCVVVHDARDVCTTTALLEEGGDRVGEKARPLEAAVEPSVLVEALDGGGDRSAARPFRLDARAVVAPRLVKRGNARGPARRDARERAHVHAHARERARRSGLVRIDSRRAQLN